MDLGKWGIPVNLIAVVMGGLLVINIGWPRAEVYDVAGACWFMQYFAVIFVALTLVVGYVAYRVVRDREGAPDPARRTGRQEEVDAERRRSALRHGVRAGVIGATTPRRLGSRA